MERRPRTRPGGCLKIQNPILTGFNPDPSILRVGDDYYIATSTFEWFPGVQIHHSRDLVHWRLLTRPLRRASQLNMLGVPDSCGVWAPCLSYGNGLFWLCFGGYWRWHFIRLLPLPDVQARRRENGDLLCCCVRHTACGTGVRLLGAQAPQWRRLCLGSP